MKGWLALWGALALGPLLAQTVESTDFAAGYARIEAERARETKALEEQEAACYQRFIVSSCLKAVQVQRVAVMNALRKQESALHAAELRQQGTDALQRLEQKAHDRSEKEAQSALDAAESPDRVQAQVEKRAAHAAKAGEARNQAPVPHEPTGPTGQEQAQNRESYAHKLADAEQRRQAITKQRADRTGKPLPDPQNSD